MGRGRAAMAYSETSDEEVDLDDPNLDAALHQAEQLLGIPPDPNEYVRSSRYMSVCTPVISSSLCAVEHRHQEYEADVVQQLGQVILSISLVCSWPVLACVLQPCLRSALSIRCRKLFHNFGNLLTTSP